MAAALVGSLALSLPFLFVLARRPILRRLALRNAVRRPREALLVVLGSLLGAAIVTGSFVVGDTMDASIRQLARAHLGPIDELVVARTAGEWTTLAARLQTLPRNGVDGVLPLAAVEGAVTSGRGATLRSAPRAQILQVDFARARSFGEEPDATGMRGASPQGLRAAVTTDVARTLHLREGARIVVHAYGRSLALTVDRILPRRGVAGFWLGYEQEARNVFVSRGAFERILGGTASSGAPPSWLVAVSNRGDVEGGVGLTESVKADIRERSARIAPQVLAVKKLALDQADESGSAFTTMFTAMGSFGVFAGLLLLVNLFVMLAAERKPELGMARAVGMRRSALVGAFATEGFLYALAATALGTLVGIGLGGILVFLSERAFDTEHSRFDLFFTLRPASLARAFAFSLAVAVLTIAATSARISRLNIIRAIRDIPEPPPKRRRRWLVLGAAAAALGALWALAAVPADDPYGLLLGPALLLVGIGPALARLVAGRAAPTLLAALVVVWGGTVFALFPGSVEGADIMAYVLQGMVMTGGGVVLVTLQQERIGGLLRRFARRILALRLGLAYPLARRSRTGLTVAMYALVVFILTFITAIAHMIDRQLGSATASVGGGAQVLVSSSPANPIPLYALTDAPGVKAVAPLAVTTANFSAPGSREPQPWRVSVFDVRLLWIGPPKLDDRGSYPSDAAAWNAVIEDPSLIIVNPAFLQTSGGPPGFEVEVGTRLTLTDPVSGRSRRVTVAALSPVDYFVNHGAFYGDRGALDLFGDDLVASRAYLALEPGVDPESFAAGLQARYLRHGAEAASIAALMDEAFTETHQIFQLFQGYLGLGLLVGIAGIAVVMVRAVRERRRQIGTLRAIGFGSRSIGRSFAVEAGFVAAEGTVLGASLALLTLYTIVTRSNAMGELAFAVPVVPLVLLLGGTVVASLLATVGPALAATRIRPAVALRLTD